MAKYREYFYYEGYVICMYKGEAKWKIPDFEENGFRKLEDAMRYIDGLNEKDKGNQMHIEYYHGYKNAVKDLCLFFQKMASKTNPVKVNKVALKSITNLILESGEKGFMELTDKGRVWQDKKGEFFIKCGTV